MAEGRRGPGWVSLSGVALLLGSVGAAAWFWSRPSPEPVKPLDATQLDVYCSGRVDAAGMVVALEPAQASRVVEVFVAEGAKVQKDQPLMLFDPTYADVRVIQAQMAIEAADIELAQAQRSKERFPGQLAARQATLNATAARVEAAEKMLQQRREQQTLNPLGRYEIEAMDAQLREVRQLEVAEKGQFEDLKKLEAELDLRLRAGRARLQSANADKTLADKARRECTLSAPGPGTVLRLQATAGGTVAPGTPVPPVIFAPAGPYVVRAEIDQEALGRVTEGMRAHVQDENRPDGPQWKGRVRSVSGWVALRRTLVLEPGEISDVRTVECVIELEPGGEPLWIGQRMRVRILRGE